MLTDSKTKEKKAIASGKKQKVKQENAAIREVRSQEIKSKFGDAASAAQDLEATTVPPASSNTDDSKGESKKRGKKDEVVAVDQEIQLAREKRKMAKTENERLRLEVEMEKTRADTSNTNAMNAMIDIMRTFLQRSHPEEKK